MSLKIPSVTFKIGSENNMKESNSAIKAEKSRLKSELNKLLGTARLTSSNNLLTDFSNNEEKIKKISIRISEIDKILNQKKIKQNQFKPSSEIFIDPKMATIRTPPPRSELETNLLNITHDNITPSSEKVINSDNMNFPTFKEIGGEASGNSVKKPIDLTDDKPKYTGTIPKSDMNFKLPESNINNSPYINEKSKSNQKDSFTNEFAQISVKRIFNILAHIHIQFLNETLIQIISKIYKVQINVYRIISIKKI